MRIQRLSRRSFLRNSLAASLAFAVWPPISPAAAAQPVPGFGARSFTTPVPLPGTSGSLARLEACHPLVATLRSSDGLVPDAGTETPHPPSPLVFTAAKDAVSGLPQGRPLASPLLLLQSGCTFRIRVRNALDAPCTPHWRGLIADWQNTLPLQPLAPGGEYGYTATVRNRASTLLYHALTPGRAAEQVQLGLCGMLLVDDATDRMLSQNYGLQLGTTDLPLLLHERTFDAYGFADGSGQTPYGNALLVNGVIGGSIEVPPAPIRLRLANGCATRILDLGLDRDGTALPMLLIATDCGQLPATETIGGAFVAPGERIECMVDLRGLAEGTDIYLVSRGFTSSYPAGKLATPPEGAPCTLLRLRIRKAEAPVTDRPLPGRLAEPLAALPPVGGQARRVRLVWPHGFDTVDGKPWTSTPLQLPHRQRETWEFDNAADGVPYPVHCGGLAFRVLSRRGGPDAVKGRATHPEGRLPTDEGLKDTVLIWPGEVVRISIDFSVRRAPASIPLLFATSRLDSFDAGHYRTIVLPPLMR